MHGLHFEMSYRVFWEITRIRTIKILFEISLRATKIWDAECLKLHMLHSHLDFFRENLGAVSEEHGERFHQDIAKMEKRYQGRWDSAMMGDYIWNLVREDKSTYQRQPRSNVHF